VVRDNYRAVTPPLQDLTSLGFNIFMECNKYDTYNLVREDQPVGEFSDSSSSADFLYTCWSRECRRHQHKHQ